MDQWLGIIERSATCLFSCANKRASYVYKLEENVESLRGKGHQLEDMFNDINIRIQTAENTGEMQRKNEVETWLHDVCNLHKEIKDVLDSHETRDNKCLRGYCSKNCVSQYKVGKKIYKNIIPNVDELLIRGRHFDSTDIANKLPPKPVDEMPNVETIGLDFMLNKVWNSIADENISIIGLHGMAGVGKTTLLKRIHNEFGKRKHDFSLVLWVVVSRDCDINRIMNDIRNRIGIDDNSWSRRSSQDQRGAMIYQVLKQKKFVMMIDDIWDKFELEKVGVPTPKETNNKSKIIFTTRLEDVCNKMQAKKKFEVKCLLEKEAFDLFCQKVGDETLKSHKEIPNLAGEMTKECAGLPLALTTVGSAMAGVKSIKAWKQAKNDLRRSSWTTSEWEDKVFEIIKFSYDRLPDDTHKSCFLYCALYPEDHELTIEDLIFRWIGEGFLSEDKTKKSSYDMYEQGESIIEKLKLSCLLESFTNNPMVDNVKMHDVIRDMALWITRDKDKNKDKVLVEGEALALSDIDSERLNVVEKISIIIDGEGRECKVQACPNLTTLCIRSQVRITDYSNLKFMERLKVLDLRGRNFSKPPSNIGTLLNLEYLNLSDTEITNRFLVELKNFKKLRILIMEDVNISGSDDIFPLEGIESLEQLKVFIFSYSMFRGYFKEEKELLEKLDSLPQLEEVHMKLTEISAVHYILLESKKLLSCARRLAFSLVYNNRYEMPLQTLLESLSRMKHLEFVYVTNANIIEGGLSITNTLHFRNLLQIQIRSCSAITHLTWLKYAPLLECIVVQDCKSIEEVVRETEDGFDRDNLFHNLRGIYLYDLPMLKGINKRALDFPSLKVILVYSCFNLRKLPLDSSSAAKDSLVEIRGEIKWWEGLKWEDPVIKDQLSSKFKPIQSCTHGIQ